MTNYGYTLMCEQSGPRALVDDAVRAEEAGFDFAVVSDHYSPWLEEQGHSPYAWSVLGATAQATERMGLMSFVTCPIRRYHPAVVAQKAATMGVLSEGRFTLGLGAGENLNEHVVGPWPSVTQRHDMFTEALEIIQGLLDGSTISFTGEYYEVGEARLFDVPQERVPVAVAVSGPDSCALAAEYADGIVATEPDRELVRQFTDAGGNGRRYGQVAICYGPDAQECRRLCTGTVPLGPLGWKARAELPNPAAIAAATEVVRDEDVAAAVSCGPDLDQHVGAVAAFAEAGFTDIAVVQVGGDEQGRFLQWARDEFLPALRELDGDGGET